MNPNKNEGLPPTKVRRISSAFDPESPFGPVNSAVDPEYLPDLLRPLGPGQFGPVGSNPPLAPAPMQLAPSSAAMASSHATIESAYDGVSQEIDVMIQQDLPEGLTEEMPDFDIDEEEQTIGFFARMSGYISSSREAVISGRETIGTIITKLGDIKNFITSIGDEVINDTRIRNKEQKRKETVEKIISFERFLQNQKDQTKKIMLDDVLKMISLEVLLEDIMNELLLSSPRKLAPLLVEPLVKIISSYEEYFSWEKQLTGILIDKAYKEFINKQRILNLLQAHFESIANITLNDVIDELFRLYNTNFNTLENPDEEMLLNIDGRITVLEQIATKPEETVLTVSGETPILSSIDYDGIWDFFSKPKTKVELSYAQLRREENAEALNIPATTGIKVGKNTASIMPSVVSDARAALASPFARVAPAPDDFAQMVYEDEDEDENDARARADEELPVVGRMGKTPQQKALETEMGAAMAAATLARRGQAHLIPQSYIDRNRRIQELAAKKAARGPSARMGEIAALSEEESKLITHSYNLIISLSNALKNVGNRLDNVFANKTPEEKTVIWDREVQRIFLNLYIKTKLIKEKRAALTSAKTKPPIGKGGIKSHKKQKKQQKKQTRKTGGKRSTRKLQKKNHKKRSGHTKKQ